MQADESIDAREGSYDDRQLHFEDEYDEEDSRVSNLPDEDKTPKRTSTIMRRESDERRGSGFRRLDPIEQSKRQV